MSSSIEYDLRQIKLMQKKIELFESKKIELYDFIQGMEGLLNALESTDTAWKGDIQAEINFLEMLHCSTLDGSISKWKGNPNQDISKSIAKLKILIEKYFQLLDPTTLDSILITDSNWVVCPKCHNAWELSSSNTIEICPNCARAFRNPHVFSKKQ